MSSRSSSKSPRRPSVCSIAWAFVPKRSTTLITSSRSCAGAEPYFSSNRDLTSDSFENRAAAHRRRVLRATSALVSAAGRLERQLEEHRNRRKQNDCGQRSLHQGPHRGNSPLPGRNVNSRGTNLFVQTRIAIAPVSRRCIRSDESNLVSRLMYTTWTAILFGLGQ